MGWLGKPVLFRFVVGQKIVYGGTGGVGRKNFMELVALGVFK
jgi:hypothetical protein